MIDPRSIQLPITRITANTSAPTSDHLAVEEPLEIRLAFGPSENRTTKSIAITMRTPAGPSEDFELAVGFLFAEGIIQGKSQIQQIVNCGPETGKLRLHNIVRIELTPETSFDLQRLERNFYMTSSCGVCGKTSIDALKTACSTPLNDNLLIPPETIHALPEFLRSAQSVFDTTGGLHAAALFTPQAKLLTLREDVGRHNALDKLIGSQFLNNTLPLQNTLLLLSGRASFELLQKSIMARIPIVAAVGAPSSLAVDLAQEFNITLLGFVRNNRFNIYSAPSRIIDNQTQQSGITSTL